MSVAMKPGQLFPRIPRKVKKHLQRVFAKRMRGEWDIDSVGYDISCVWRYDPKIFDANGNDINPPYCRKPLYKNLVAWFPYKWKKTN